MVAATEADVIVRIGCDVCNITSMSNEAIYCEPPKSTPLCSNIKENMLIIKVCTCNSLSLSLYSMDKSLIPCMTSVDLDQPAIPCSLIRIYTLCFLVRNNLTNPIAASVYFDQTACYCSYPLPKGDTRVQLNTHPVFPDVLLAKVFWFP
jgi:hypothetical protein